MAEKTWFITGTSFGFGREWAAAALERGDALLALPLDVTDPGTLVSSGGLGDRGRELVYGVR